MSPLLQEVPAVRRSAWMSQSGQESSASSGRLLLGTQEVVLACGAGRKLLRPSKKRGQSKDRVPETRTLWQHGQETPVSTPRPTGTAGQASQEAAAPLLHGPFL